jgi:hypothetical protein
MRSMYQQGRKRGRGVITKRGKRARAVAIAAGVALIVWVSGSWWWVGIGSPKADFLGWCIGSMSECVGL